MADTGRYFGIGLDTKELEKSIEKGKQAFAKLGDEALKQGKIIDKVFSGQDISSNLDAEFKRLSRLSIDAFGSISADAQRIMKEIQEDTLSLGNVEKMMHGLNNAYEDGSISTQEYITASARLTVLHEQIAGAIQQNEQVLRRKTQQMEIAGDSIVSMQAKVALLTTEYMKLSEAQRNSVHGEGLLKQMSELQTKLSAAQASMQRFGGAATAQFNMLGMSMQQIVRELPSLAMGPQMFFLAISNNLPMFTDALAQARKEYQLLTAAGKTATPVWKQVVSSLLSWQTALSALPAVLIVLGPQIANFFQSFFTGKDKIDKAKEAIKAFNETMLKGEQNAQKEITNLELLYNASQNLSKPIEERRKAVDELQRLYPDYLGNISDEEFLAGKAADAYTRLSSSIIASAKAQAARDKIVEEQNKVLENEQKKADANIRLVRANDRLYREIELLNNLSGTAEAQEFQAGVVKSAQNRVDDIKKEIEGYQSAIDQANKISGDLEKSINISDLLFDASTSKESDKNKKAIDTLKSYLDEVTKLNQENEDRQVDLMKDGTDKQLAEINLRYDRELAAVRKLRAELEKAQGGKLTNEQTGIFEEAITGIESGRKRDTNVVMNKQLQESRKAMNRYLAEYGSYLQRRQAITEQYQEKIDSATNEWDKKYLQSQMTEALAKLDDEVQKKTSVITRLFGDMSKKSVDEMRSIADEAERLLSFIESGEYQQDNAFGITKEQFDILSKSPEKLESVKNEIENVRNEADKTEAELRGLNDILKFIFKTTDKKELEKLFEQLNEKVGKFLQTAQFLSSVFSNLGDAFGSDALSGVAEGLNTAMNAVNSAMQGAQAGAMFGGIGAAAGAAVGVVSSLASAIAKIHDKKNERRIQKLQEQIDVLDASYEKLGRSIEKAYSTDASKMIEQQNKLLEQQKVLIQQQIREEEDKKKTDDERIREWEQQIDDINAALEENKEKAVEAITGTDVMSAIDDFAQAYANAWAAGTDAAKASTDTVKNLIKTSLLEFLKKQLSPDVEEFMTKLGEYMSDGIINPWEQSQLDNLKDKMDNVANNYFNQTSDYWKDEETTSGNQQSASSGGFATMSQDSADELNGRFTALQMSAEEIKSQISIGNVNLEIVKNTALETKDIIQSCYNELAEINANTGAIVKPIQTMQRDISEMKNDIKNKF